MDMGFRVLDAWSALRMLATETAKHRLTKLVRQHQY
jgi:hypothetical protein